MAPRRESRLKREKIEPFESRVECSRELFCIHSGDLFISATDPLVGCEGGGFFSRLDSFVFDAVSSLVLDQFE